MTQVPLLSRRAGAPAVHRQQAPPVAAEAAGAQEMHRPPAPPTAASQTTRAVGAPVIIPMDRSLAAPVVATPTASLPAIPAAAAVPMGSAAGARAQQQVRGVDRASLL